MPHFNAGADVHQLLKVAANDFVRQWSDVREDALAAVDRVGKSGWFVLGSEVQAFEQELAKWWGASHAIGVASGLDALEIGLRCSDIGPGARVLTTPLTAFATTLAVIRAGAEPVWCDIDESGSLDLNRADDALRADPTIRAVLPVHLYGHPLDPAGIDRLTREHDVVVIEDCAQSAGAERDGEPTGLSGSAAGVSLYPTKNLGAMGDGGVLLTEDEALADRARTLRDYGQADRYEHAEIGLNSRLDELHAAILRSALLPRLDGWLARRRAIAAHYDNGLAESALRPIAPGGGRSARHLYPVEVEKGDPGAVAARIAARGVSVGRHYPVLCPDQPAAAAYGTGSAADSLDVARRISENVLSLPIHPYLTDDEIEAVVKACQAACS